MVSITTFQSVEQIVTYNAKLYFESTAKYGKNIWPQVCKHCKQKPNFKHAAALNYCLSALVEQYSCFHCKVLSPAILIFQNCHVTYMNFPKVFKEVSEVFW